MRLFLRENDNRVNCNYENSIFDGQKSYSIGCITIDPNNQHVIWVGTGENVGGRHVGYGDGKNNLMQ